jgi:dihydroorotate dehydrogenase (fumarate)
MTDLATTWLGLSLSSPVVVGASPLSDDLGALQECIEGGAGAVVMRSLFEEQLVTEQLALHRHLDAYLDMDAETRTLVSDSQMFPIGAESYLARLRALRQALGVPVIASLNGTTPGGWIDLARDVAGAGAAAIELNLYDLATSPDETGGALEQRQLEVVRAVTRSVSVPVSVKLSPFYSSLPAFVRELERAGARGVVLFNRFYQPDVDIDALELSRDVRLSSNEELPLRLHALATLYGRTGLELAASGGVHLGDDAAKAVLCGAIVVQVVSAVLRDGATAIGAIVAGLRARLERMGYQKVDEARGVLSLQTAPNPHAWERLNYARLLQGWQPRHAERSKR